MAGMSYPPKIYELFILMNMTKCYIVRLVCAALLCIGFATGAKAQELNARVKINHNQIQGTDNSVFEELEQTLTQFINERQWTRDRKSVV